MRRLLDYCGLPFEDACLRFLRQRPRPVRTASSEQVRQPIYRERRRPVAPLRAVARSAEGCARARARRLRRIPERARLTLRHDFFPDTTLGGTAVTRTNRTAAALPTAACSPRRIHVACFAPAFALAADDDQATTTPSQGDNDDAPDQRKAQELGGITVTAQKRAENVQDVPISMDVLDTAKLTENNVKNLDDYVKLLPSVSIQHLYLGFDAGLHARRRERQQRQPLGPAAERRHVSRRAADHDDPGRARHAHLRHRARRVARRPAGHAVRRELAVGHDPHHHEQARSERDLRQAPRPK